MHARHGHAGGPVDIPAAGRDVQSRFYQFDAAPLLIVNSDRLNFVDDETDFDLLLQRIGEMKGPRAFFSKGD